MPIQGHQSHPPQLNRRGHNAWDALSTPSIHHHAPCVAGMSYEPQRLPGGRFKHHDGSSKSRISSSKRWLRELKKAHGGEQVLVCAKYGCRAPAELGAHIRTGFWDEVGKLVDMGGTAVVPCCKQHHPTRGQLDMRVKATPCIIDKAAPLDL